jgi:glycosyltransferase involved in cell wall biosynthesis
MQKYLKLFLEKLPEQTYFEHIEVILDHNEPSDEELKWIDEFQKKHPGRLKHIKIEKVDPIGISMNRCIREASGDFLAIWNVDDLRTPTSLEAQSKILLEHPDISIVHGPYKVVRKFGSMDGEFISSKGLPESELTRSMIVGPFFMFRRALCEKAGLFDEQLRSGADFDFAIRLAMHGKVAMTETELGYYLNEGLGASTRPNSRQPVERTVIELRYGIYDKIDYDFLPSSQQYSVPYLLQEQDWLPVRDFVPDYDAFLAERQLAWFLKGIYQFSKRKVLVEPFLKLKKSLKRLLRRSVVGKISSLLNKNDSGTRTR